ncbi:hypothetical protein EWM64_g1442 [Hericium alpestre]|uniref:Uncharacterized protein n=1 Tax=Hericium alpestre TaxID=135208 RepID=A0A4Z0A9I3_9AGAM|nr:hypothetical protein EWM64_g1442 [Hericium alpestre]
MALPETASPVQEQEAIPLWKQKGLTIARVRREAESMDNEQLRKNLTEAVDIKYVLNEHEECEERKRWDCKWPGCERQYAGPHEADLLRMHRGDRRAAMAELPSAYCLVARLHFAFLAVDLAVCNFAGPGAEVFALPHKDGDFATAADALKDTLHGVDILVNPGVGQISQMDNLLMEAASAARVCVSAALGGVAALRPDEGSMNMQVVSIHAGLCVENVLSTGAEGMIRVPARRTPYTSTLDLGRTLAELSILAMTSPARVPAIVHVAGDVVSGAQIAEMVHRLQNGGTMVVIERDGTLRVEDGGADNELVNPGERLWKWKKVQNVLTEV